MKLISCYVENFGKLHDYGIDFTEGANVICQKNGWGKSTLVAFIRAMFYGLEGERKRNIEDNEWKRYTPWQGGVFGGRLTFEVSGKQYVVTRTFQGQESFELRDTGTNLISHDYSSNLGEELFHVDKASFMRTVFLGQADCETAVTDDINAKIGNLTENSNDLNSFAAANQRLKELMNSLTPSRKTGSLSKRKTEITELERKVAVQKELPNALLSKQTAYAKGRKSHQQQKETLQLAEQEQIRLSQLEKVLAKKEQWEQLKKECQRARAAFPGSVPSMEAIEEAQLYDSEMQKTLVSCNQYQMPGSFNAPISVIGVLLAVIGLTLAWIGFGFHTLFAGCTGVAVAVIGATLIRKHACRYRKWSQKNQEYEVHKQQVLQFLKQQDVIPEQNLQAQLVHMRDALQVYQYAMQQLAEFEKETDTEALSRETKKRGEETLSQVNDRIRNMREKLAESERHLRCCQTDLERLQEQLEEWEEDRNRLEVLKELQEQEQKKYNAIVKVQEYLTKAKESLTNRYSKPILNRFCSYFQLLTEDNTEKFLMDANTKLWVNEQGNLRETNTQSLGLRDLMGICLRISLVDAMYKEELPMLILDDPFTNLDDDKMRYARKFLNTLAEKYQIIYFTCSEARK